MNLPTITKARLQTLVAVSGLVFFVAGYLVLPSFGRAMINYRPPTFEFGIRYDDSVNRILNPDSGFLEGVYTVEILGQEVTGENYRKCDHTPPQAAPVVWVARRSESELVFFIDNFGFFGNARDKLSRSTRDYISGIVDDPSSIKVPAQIIDRMSLYSSSKPNCLDFEIRMRVDGHRIGAPVENKNFDVSVVKRTILSAFIEEKEQKRNVRFAALDVSHVGLNADIDTKQGAITVHGWPLDILTISPSKTFLPIVGTQFIVDCRRCELVEDDGLAAILRVTYDQVPFASKLTKGPRTVIKNTLSGSSGRHGHPVPTFVLSSGRYYGKELEPGTDFYLTAEEQDIEGLVATVWEDSSANQRANLYMSFGGLLMGVGVTLIIESLIYFIRRKAAT